MAPSDENECRAMLEAGYDYPGPAVVRYPRGGENGKYVTGKREKIIIGKSKVVRKGEKVAILAFGSMVGRSKKAAEKLGATLLDMRFIKPLDEELLDELLLSHEYFITIEDNTILGGAGSAVNEYFSRKGVQIFVKNLGLPDEFLPHGTRDEILSEVGLDEDGILDSVTNFLKGKL